MKRLRKLLLAGASTLGVLVALQGTARAVTVEKVVAVVGDQAIFLSDLRRRARPLLADIAARVPAGPERNAVEGQMFKDLLQAVVDERLIQLAADKSQKRVTTEEVDRGLQNLAASQGLSADELVTEAVKSGMTPQELRLQVQRQLLEQKMLSLRVMPRVRISPEDVRAGYAKLQREERKRLSFTIEWVVLHPAKEAERAEKRETADKVAQLARSGTPFAELAKRYSDDAATREKGGALDPLRPGQLNPQLDEVALSLDVGEVSAPFAFGQDFIVMRLAKRDPSKLPPLEAAHERVAQEVFTERLMKARRQWLDELRRANFVDVRM